MILALWFILYSIMYNVNIKEVSPRRKGEDMTKQNSGNKLYDINDGIIVNLQ